MAFSSSTIPLCVTVSQQGKQLHLFTMACVYMHKHAQTKAHTTLRRALNPSHLSTDSSGLSAHPYIKVVCAFLLPVASDKPQSIVLRPLLHAAIHISLQLLYQSALSTLISFLSEEQRRDVQRRGKNEKTSFLWYYLVFPVRCDKELVLYKLWTTRGL